MKSCFKLLHSCQSPQFTRDLLSVAPWPKDVVHTVKAWVSSRGARWAQAMMAERLIFISELQCTVHTRIGCMGIVTRAL